MLILNSTDTITVQLNTTVTTNQLQFYASFRDISPTGGTFNPSRNSGITNNTSSVNLITSPAASTNRVIDYVSVYNSDTVAHTVTISHFDGVNSRIIFRATISVGETIAYQEGQGFVVLNNLGAVKQALNQGASPTGVGFSTVVLAADVVNAELVAQAIVDVTGLSFPVAAGGLYWFRFFLLYNVNASTNGVSFAINGPGATLLAYETEATLTTNTAALSKANTAYDLPSVTGNATAATSGNTAKIEGFIQSTVDGNVIARVRKELNTGSATVLTGSFVNYQQIM